MMMIDTLDFIPFLLFFALIMAILIICIMFPTLRKLTTGITTTGENLIPSRKSLPQLRIVPRLLPRPCQIVWVEALVPHLPCG